MEIIYGLGGLLFYSYFLTYIGMGFVQPLGAIVRLLCEKRKDSTYAVGLKKYLFSVISYFLFLYIMLNLEVYYDIFYMVQIYLFLVPWAFAIWYMRHIRKWNKKRKSINAYDKLQLQNAPHEDRLILDSYPKKKIQVNYLDFKVNKDNLDIHRAIIKKLPTLLVAK